MEVLPLQAARKLASLDAYRTDDLDAAQRHIGQLFCPHRLYVVGRDQKLDVCVGGAELKAAALLYHRHGAHVRVTPESLRHCFLLQVPLRGAARVMVDAQEVVCTPDHGVLISPTSHFDMEFGEGCEQLIVRFDRSALEQYLEQQLHRPLDAPLTFHPHVALTGECGHALRTTLAYMLTMLGSGTQEVPSPLMACGLTSVLFGTLVSSLPHNYREALDVDVAGTRPRCLKRALTYMEERARTAITPEEVARAVDVSPRTLFAVFKRHLNTTPMRHIKNLRLDLAHQELRRGTPVTTVALELGFNHLGHFSAAYKARFGHLPSEAIP